MEVTDTMTFRKSSYSSSGGADCVEVGTSNAVMVRDTKQANDDVRTTLNFDASSWSSFVSHIK